MKYENPFKRLTKFEWGLWMVSVLVVTISFITAGNVHYMTLVASLTGVTALVFVAKGDVAGQILTVLFSLLYAVISYQFRYFGEMITYLGMTAPIAVMSVVSWLRNPYQDTAEVKVHRLNREELVRLVTFTILVTWAFYYILAAFGTNNLFMSTVSIATSFSASYLMLYRSPWYALAYAGNDIVLIVLWVLATFQNRSFLPMIVCFIMFFFNDIYGFLNWRKMRARQRK